MPLTDTAIKQAKPAATPYKLTDEKGMYLYVHPSGGKLWRFDYRFEGKRKTLALGAYPDINLKQARIYRDEARQLIANGTDPGELRKAEKVTLSEAKQEAEQAAELERMVQSGEALPGSFRAVALEWEANHMANKADSHKKKVMGRLERDVFPYLGNLPADAVTAPLVLEIIRRVESRGTIETAHRTKHHISQVMNYAVATGRATYNPCPALSGALIPKPSPKHFAAPTEPKDVAPLLRVMAGYKGSPLTKCALTLAPLLFIRPGELRAMEWANIDFEACELRYTPPKTRNKTAIEIIVPLARQAVAALRELQPLTGGGRYVFPGARTDTRPMSANTVNAALKRLGIDTENELTGHGFRAMARTLLDEVHGFNRDAIELQLAHQIKDPLGRAYNRTKHLSERKRMMQTWADYLDALREGKNVIHADFGKVA
ncbi:MAG: integrase arm-type DNA-binding domain-containing protein [Halothiobacillaceae bacterium]|nr:integrase arm-type DNA-binding domain-containing protein [Halothiobacillaceae bacterium]